MLIKLTTKGGFSNGMDPQKLSQLDPKLRDAYQRVMGTAVPKPQTAFSQTKTPQDPISAPQIQSQPKAEPITPPTSAPVMKPKEPDVISPNSFSESQPTVNPYPPIPNQEAITPPQPPTQNPDSIQMNSEVPTAPATNSSNFTTPIQNQTAVIKKKKNLLMPILIGIVILVFIVIYTLFWTKIFNLDLPFLS